MALGNTYDPNRVGLRLNLVLLQFSVVTLRLATCPIILNRRLMTFTVDIKSSEIVTMSRLTSDAVREETICDFITHVDVNNTSTVQ